MIGDSKPILVELVSCPSLPRPGGQLGEMPFRADAWTPTEIRQLRQLFADDLPIGEIAKALGRGRGGVADRICLLGLRRHSFRSWTSIEDEDLVRRYGQDATATIAAELGRTCAAVYARAALLDLSEGNAPDWTPWEDAQLRAGFVAGISTAQIATIVGRTHSGLVSRASKLGLRHPNFSPGWSNAEIERVLALAEAGHRYAAIGQMLCAEGFVARTKSGVRGLMNRLGAGKGWGRFWSDEEDALLIRAYQTNASLTPLRQRLGRSGSSIRWRADYLGLRGTHGRTSGWRGGPDWTEADVARLREDYGKVPTAELARAMGRSKASIFTRANLLGLVHGFHRPWSDEECAALEIAFARGIAMADLAAALGRKQAAVHKYAANRGFRFGRRAKAVFVMSVADILKLGRQTGEEGEERSDGMNSAPEQETSR
ncbi:hypothetical protein [Novosphingobium sp.]|uniref:hypothetical protein n=1 Tax=Novosphingobium sp. TaxID=1874826 RepID=UPI0025F989CF|nr:hypothetical protein [Novosphingobium sp.]